MQTGVFRRSRPIPIFRFFAQAAPERIVVHVLNLQNLTYQGPHRDYCIVYKFFDEPWLAPSVSAEIVEILFISNCHVARIVTEYRNDGTRLS